MTENGDALRAEAELIWNLFDFRVLIFTLVTLGVCAMCVRTIVSNRTGMVEYASEAK